MMRNRKESAQKKEQSKKEVEHLRNITGKKQNRRGPEEEINAAGKTKELSRTRNPNP